MPKEKDILENVKTTENEATKIRNDKFTWKKFVNSISYKGVVNNIPFMSFLALIGIFYISNNNTVLETSRELDRQQKILKELKWSYMDAQSRLTNICMEGEIFKRGMSIGLQPLIQPAHRIQIDSSLKRNSHE